MQNNKRIRKRKKTRRRKEVPGVNRGKIGGQSKKYYRCLESTGE
jgi:hypothetical protein